MPNSRVILNIFEANNGVKVKYYNLSVHIFSLYTRTIYEYIYVCLNNKNKHIKNRIYENLAINSLIFTVYTDVLS